MSQYGTHHLKYDSSSLEPIRGSTAIDIANFTLDIMLN